MAHMARVYAALFVWRKGELGIDEQQGPEDIAPNWRIPGGGEAGETPIAGQSETPKKNRTSTCRLSRAWCRRCTCAIRMVCARLSLPTRHMRQPANCVASRDDFIVQGSLCPWQRRSGCWHRHRNWARLGQVGPMLAYLGGQAPVGAMWHYDEPTHELKLPQ